MRRWLALVVTLAACGELRDAGRTDFEPAHEGRFTVATELPSPAFWNGTSPDAPGEGFEWALARALADRFDLELDVVAVPFDDIVAGDLGGADVALAQIAVTAERERQLAFSIPYLTVDTGVVVPSDEEPITDLATARDRTWAVREGTTTAELLEEVVRPAGIREVATEEAAIEAVAGGEVDAAAMDLPLAEALLQERTDVAVRAVFATEEPLAAALPLSSPNREPLDAALRALRRDGTLSALAERWLGVPGVDEPHDLPVIRIR